jgi:hypothetical protein
MLAESEGRGPRRRKLFECAWETASNDYEACIVTHHLTRHQEAREQTLAWNEESLGRADLVGDARIAGFLPSLCLNPVRRHEELAMP